MESVKCNDGVSHLKVSRKSRVTANMLSGAQERKNTRLTSTWWGQSLLLMLALISMYFPVNGKIKD